VAEGLNNLPIAVPVASQLPHAVGIGWAIQYQKQDHVVMTFMGDGATSEGDFHEAMNFAGVFQAPVVFVCQNNQWAISIPRSKQTLSKTIAQKAVAYGMPGIQVDGLRASGQKSQIPTAKSQRTPPFDSGRSPSLRVP